MPTTRRAQRAGTVRSIRGDGLRGGRDGERRGHRRGAQHEGRSLEFRAELFNPLNRANLGFAHGRRDHRRFDDIAADPVWAEAAVVMPAG